MAKQPKSKLAPAARKPKVDPLALSLQNLALYDQASAGAVSALGYVLQVPVDPPDVTTCQFSLKGKTYFALLTVHQCDIILQAVANTNNKKQIEAVVNGLFGAISLEVNNAFNSLSKQLELVDRRRVKGKQPDMPIPPANNSSTPGCCVYDGGMISHITQSVCQAYTPISWTAGDCPKR